MVVALWIAADAHPASDGFGRNLFLFSLLGAMAAAVWLEFLARPGVLVRAQTGLQSVPHPVRSVRRRGRRVQRYAEITRIAVRNGLGPSLGLGRKEDVEAAGARPPVRRLRLALEECGGMFVKLGQVLSTRTDLISPQAAAELGLLQDHVRPAPRDAIAEVLEEELDTPVPDVFPGFDWHPLAAASIGQVYRAQLPDGSPVVVKVQRPGIDESVRVDLSVLEELGHVVESRTTWGARVPGRRPGRRVLGPLARGARLPDRGAQRALRRVHDARRRAHPGPVRLRGAQHFARARDGVARRHQRARGRLGRRPASPTA